MAALCFVFIFPTHLWAQSQTLPLPPFRPSHIPPPPIFTPAKPLEPSSKKGDGATSSKNLDSPTIERVNAYFNTIKGMRADFVQYSPNGREYLGVLYLLRPGRLRFEYRPPNPLEIVADGRSVAVRDRKLQTQDLYFVAQTPLKFLLQPRIDVSKDTSIQDLRRIGQDIVLTLEDKSTFGGTSQIRIFFDGESHALKEWIIIDAQGAPTRVVLSNSDFAYSPDPELFVIDEQKLVEPRN